MENKEIKKYEMYSGRSEYLKTSNEKFNEATISEEPGKKPIISESNRRLFQKFQNYLLSTGSGQYRVGKLTSQMRILLSWNVLKTDLNKATSEDIQALVGYINSNSKYAEATKSDYRRLIKQFYKWYKKDDDLLYGVNGRKRQKFYDFINEIVIAYKKKQIDSKSILTEEDCEVLVKAAKSIKEKALIKFLHESGARAGELLNMKIGDVLIGDIGEAELDGKTGARTIQFVKSIGLLSKWLEVHPESDNQNAYLWLSERSNTFQKNPLTHRGLYELCYRVFDRAGLKKRYNPHWFRHSRATLLAPHLTEAMLCRYMGWIIGSDQPKTYLHLCNTQVRDAFLKMHNLKKNEELREQFIQCGCGTQNEAINRYCAKCGLALRVEDALNDRENKDSQVNITLNKMMKVMENPEVWKQFKEFKQNISA